MERKKIVFISRMDAFGGVESVFFELFNLLKDKYEFSFFRRRKYQTILLIILIENRLVIPIL